MTEELKPCPLCKKKVTCEFVPEQEFGEWDHYSVSCIEPNSHIVQVIRMTKEEAIAAWNTLHGENE